jgi:hypothetical protein
LAKEAQVAEAAQLAKQQAEQERLTLEAFIWAEEAALVEEAHLAEEARLAEAAQLAEQKAEQERLALQSARLAEEAHLAEEALMTAEVHLQRAQLGAASSEEKGIVGEAKPAPKPKTKKSVPRSEGLGVNYTSVNEEEGIFHIKKKTRCTSSELLRLDHESAKANSENDSEGEPVGQDTQGFDALWREDLWAEEGLVFDKDDVSISSDDQDL